MSFLDRWLSPLTGVTDEQAMWRLQTQDDHAAFAELMRRWEGPIRHLCCRMVGDEHRGQDLAQEAFTRVFTRRKDFRHGSKVSTWLWRIALNLCHDELRRTGRRVELPLETDDEQERSLPAEGPAPDAQLESAERADAVRAALQRLTPAQRAVVVMRHYENLKFREIAEVLGIPEGTVKSRMSEALAALSRHLRIRLPEVAGESAGQPPSFSVTHESSHA